MELAGVKGGDVCFCEISRAKNDSALSFPWGKNGTAGIVGLELWIAERFRETLDVNYGVDICTYRLWLLPRQSAEVNFLSHAYLPSPLVLCR